MRAPELSRVAAVVLTHSRPRLATRVVRSLVDEERLPPERVVLVVNGSGGLDDPALEEAVVTIRLQENLGPAGGFREGMIAASRLAGVDWLYLCEDDICLLDLPTPRLGALIAEIEALPASGAASDRPVGAVVAYGRDLRRRTGHTVHHSVDGPGGFDEVDAASWGASLVRKSVVDEGILPDPSLFFGFEDFDFWYRMQSAGYRLLVDRTAAAAVERQMSLAGRQQAFVGERPNDAAEPWRAFYVARDFFSLARRHGSATWLLAHLGYSVRRLQLATSSSERRAILDGLLAGALGRSGRDPRYLRRQGELPVGTSGGTEERRAVARPRRVLHVLPSDSARGAQVSARELRDALDSPLDEHRILTLFAAAPAVLFPDYSLDLPMGRWRQRGWDPRVARRLRTALVVLRPDVVVAHGGEPLKYLAFATPAGVPLVYLAFGIVAAQARRGLRRRLYRHLMDRATVVAGISKETVEEAEQIFGIPPGRLALLPNGRDPDVYRPAPPAARADDFVTLISVGHLDETKRPERFVAVVEELSRRGLAVRGVIVGDGPREEELRASAACTAVEILGRRTDVPALLSGAQVFVFTGAPPEGMPGVLIEAGLAGLPVVATDVPGASTVVEHRRSGFVVPVHDLGAMVDAVEHLVVDPELRAEMGAAGRERCLQEFSLAAEARRWRELLDRLAPLPSEAAAAKGGR